MIGIPVNPNSVFVPVVQTGCFKVEFDTTYPIHLYGIINQTEFQESINRINRTISPNKILIFLAVIFGLSIIGGMICFIVGGVTASRSYTYGFPALIGVGIALSIVGSLVFGLGCCTVQFQRVGRMRQAIAAESRKYSSRSPTPCSWRLDTTRNWDGGYRNYYHNQLIYHLVIDIGRSTKPTNRVYYSNQVASEPTLLFGQQDNDLPPPYSDHTVRFCSQCSAPRHNLTANFCSSCGSSFNKY